MPEPILLLREVSGGCALAAQPQREVLKAISLQARVGGCLRTTGPSVVAHVPQPRLAFRFQCRTQARSSLSGYRSLVVRMSQ